MFDFDPARALSGLPNLLALHQELKLIHAGQSGHVPASETPIIVDEIGRLCVESEEECIEFIHFSEAGDYHTLDIELQRIAFMVMENGFTEEELQLLEQWSESLCEHLKEMCRGFDEITAQNLKNCEMLQ